jgi:hypothetical protein
MILAACLDMLKVPTTLILRTLSISSDERTPFEVTIIPTEMIPAQLTTAPILPNFLIVKSKSLITFSSLLTSVLKNSHPESY